jgi:hypothetical protein
MKWTFLTLATIASLCSCTQADRSFSWGITESQVQFSGFPWFLKDAPTQLLQPGPCYFSGDLVQSDSNGLHLTVGKAPSGQWLSSEVMASESFGYGEYTVNVANSLGDHNEEVVLGVFLWDETNPEYNGEIDMLEASRFGDPNNPYNAQQVLAPWNVTGRINRFAIPPNAGPAVVSIQWFPSSLVYVIECPETAFKMTWSPDSSIVPQPTGFERLHINAWLNFGYPPSDGNNATFTITSFEFKSVEPGPSTGTPTPTPITTNQTPVPTQTTTPTPPPSQTPMSTQTTTPTPPPSQTPMSTQTTTPTPPPIQTPMPTETNQTPMPTQTNQTPMPTPLTTSPTPTPTSGPPSDTPIAHVPPPSDHPVLAPAPPQHATPPPPPIPTLPVYCSMGSDDRWSIEASLVFFGMLFVAVAV